MYHLIEHSDNYQNTSGSLWLYCRNEPALDSNSNIDLNNDNATDLFI